MTLNKKLNDFQDGMNRMINAVESEAGHISKRALANCIKQLREFKAEYDKELEEYLKFYEDNYT